MLPGFTLSLSLSLLWDTWETLLWQYLWEQWHSATCRVLVLLSLMPSRERDRMGAVNKKTGRHALLITRSHFRSIQWNAEESCRNVHLTRRWHGAWVISHKKLVYKIIVFFDCFLHQVCFWQLRLGAQTAPLPTGRRKCPLLHVHQPSDHGGASRF